jgi:signal peptidase II
MSKPESDSTRRDDGAPTPLPTATTRQWIFLAVVAIATAALDLGSKEWATRRLSRPSWSPAPVCVVPRGMRAAPPQHRPTREIPIVRGYFDFQYAENCGGAFSFLQGSRPGLRRPFFIFVTLAAIAFVLSLYRRLEPGQWPTRWALPLVLGGAIGNLVDRIRLGYVVDFIHVHARDKWHYPTFNVADIAIVVGVGLMLLEWVLGRRAAPRTKQPSA